jgi:hypothetical protein
MCTHSSKAQPLANSRNTTPYGLTTGSLRALYGLSTGSLRAPYGHPTGVRDPHVFPKLCFAPEVQLRERKDGRTEVKLTSGLYETRPFMVIEDHHHHLRLPEGS